MLRDIPAKIVSRGGVSADNWIRRLHISVGQKGSHRLFGGRVGRVLFTSFWLSVKGWRQSNVSMATPYTSSLEVYGYAIDNSMSIGLNMLKRNLSSQTSWHFVFSSKRKDLLCPTKGQSKATWQFSFLVMYVAVATRRCNRATWRHVINQSRPLFLELCNISIYIFF